MEPQIFNITPDRFERLKAKAAASGLHLASDIGKAAISTPLGNVNIEYTYDRAGNSLTIHCTGKPWAVPEHTVLAEIQTLITATA